MKKLFKEIKTKLGSKTLRANLLKSFVIYGLIILVILFVMQGALLQGLYQYSMEKKLEKSVENISTIYSDSENLEYKDFCSEISRVSLDNDVYFYLEAVSGEFTISSNDFTDRGRSYLDASKMFADAKKMLDASTEKNISFSIPSGRENQLVVARIVESEYRESVYLYAVATLTPLGPSVSIIRGVLIYLSIAAFIISIVVSAVTSKNLAKPIASMSASAKRLGEGDFDVHFSGGNIDEINELADTLNEAAAELKTSDELRKDLLANISHDLRTPLTMIRSYAEMIRDISGENKEKREEHLGVIIEETQRLSNLVGGILEMSKISSGAEEFKNEKFSLGEAAEDIYQTYRIVENEGFKIEFNNLEDSLVTGDVDKIKQVMSNLVSNAIKYSEDRKEISIALTKTDKYIRFTVTDKGIGISEEDINKIWSRYTRASQRGQRSKEGSGLGLSICKEILIRSNARYGVESKLGEGSCFWFELKEAK